MLFQEAPRAVPFTVKIPVVSAGTGDWFINPPITSGDAKIKKDSGTLINTVNLPSVDNVGEAWLKFNLSETEMDAEIICVQLIDQTSIKAFGDTGFVIHTSDKPTAKTVADVGNSTTSIKTNLVRTKNFAPRTIVRFLTGQNIGQVSEVISYTSATGVIVVANAFTDIVSGGEYIEFINK